VKRLRWALVLAIAIAAGGACVADVREPWMTLVADGREYPGLLISYCWSGFPATVCADGVMREPPINVVRSSAPVVVQLLTRPDLKDLSVHVGPDWRSTDVAAIDLARAGVLRVSSGTHYLVVSAYWSRGSGLFVFGLRVVPA
jgi:hypothetical protein